MINLSDIVSRKTVLITVLQAQDTIEVWFHPTQRSFRRSLFALVNYGLCVEETNGIVAVTHRHDGLRIAERIATYAENSHALEVERRYKHDWETDFKVVASFLFI